MKINDIINGYKVTQIKEVTELKGRIVLMHHIKSGARLMWLDRPDNNKTFSIAFRTVPVDDTGIFHILEHSVLCGSKKFPVKEPFVELIKNSMNTFLNALTFSDKTMYPISSKNDKDFFNLMEVYLDAVFYPAIYTKPQIFYQEGWHYELDDNDSISYKGVVFNEMKGVYADADSVKETAMCRALYPDTCYSCESGGHPSAIPDLTYQQFIDGHKRYYHPSNSYIILDGDLDIQRVTEFIDSEYLCHFDAIEPSEAPAMQAPVDAGKIEVCFEQSRDLPLENQSSLLMGYVIGTFDQKEKIYASHILSRYLCENNQSYLTSLLLDNGYAEDAYIHVTDGILQPYLCIDIKNIDEKRADEIEAFVKEKLLVLANDGLDREQLEASISNLEFELKEKDFGYPRGLMYAMLSLETWLYDGDPTANVVVGDIFERLRKKADNGYFEELIRELFFDNAHRCTLLAKPSYTAGDEQREAELARLKIVRDSWSDADLEHYRNEQRLLDEWQSSTDSPEDLAKIPMITLDDIEVEPEPLPTVVESNILKHDVQTDGIAYINMYFDITGVEEKDLPSLSLLSSLFGELDTAHHTAKELKTELMTKCGSIGFSVSPMMDYNSSHSGQIKLVASFSALNRYVDDAVALVHEILTSTKFDNQNQIVDIIKQLRQRRYQAFVSAGSMLAARRSAMSFSCGAVVDEMTNGLEYYMWLKAQESNPTVIDTLPKLAKAIIGNDNVVISICADDASAFDESIKHFVASLDKSSVDRTLKIKPHVRSNDGIVIPGDISFSAMSCDFEGGYDGLSLLMSHIVSLDYLWNEVRVKGGAYGTGLKVMSDGWMFAYSYRDPNANASVKTFGTVADYVRSFAKSDRSLVGFIIGAMSSASPLLTPRQIATGADANYFKNISYEDRLKTRQQIVGATNRELLALADRLDTAMNNGCYCVVGSKNQVDSMGNIDNIYTL